MSIMIMMFLAVATLPTLVTGQISKTGKPESKAGKLSKNGKTFTLKVLHMNDHHAHLGEESLSIKTQTLPSNITVNINKTAVPVVKLTYGGFPRLMTLLNDMEAKSTADAILKVHAGDVFSGTLFYTLFGGYADMQLMTPMCFDVMTLGNHEFDDGNANLETFLTNLTEATTNVCGSATKVVSANVIPPAGTVLASLLLPYVIMNYNGQEVAIIGLTTKDTAVVASADEGTVFLDELTTLTATVAKLEGKGINQIPLEQRQRRRCSTEVIMMIRKLMMIREVVVTENVYLSW